MEAFYAPKRAYFSRYVSFLVLLGTLITCAVYSFMPIEFTGRSLESNTSSISPGELHNSSLYADGCYIIRSKQTNKALQAMSDNTVQQQVANGQSNQIWKQEAVGAQYRFTSQAGNKDQVMQVNSAGAGELIRLGSNTGDFKQKWDMLDGGNGFIQVGLANNNITWDLRSYGNDPELQLYGTAGAPFNDFRLFSFESVSCPGAPTGGTVFSQCIEGEYPQNGGNRTTIADPSASGGYQSATYGNSGEYTIFNVNNVPSTGSYTLKLTYASGDNPKADIIVNGNTGATQRVSMPTTSSWNGTYREYSTTINLDANVNPNTIRIQGTSLGAFNLDKICVQGSSPTQNSSLSISGVNGLSNVGTGGGNGSFTINSNLSWTISGVPSWLTLNTTSGSNNGTVNVSIQSNSGATRSATLTVSGGGSSATVQIDQQGTGTTCAVSSPNGYFDNATCDVFNGWALDQSDFNKTVTVDIYVDGVKTYSVQANGSRPDVADNAYGGNPAARNHGFSFTIPANASWKNGSSHNISARICGAGGDLNNSPKSVAGCTGSASSYKVLFVGNSITYHSADPTNLGWNGNWGMAATAANKDYKNLLVAKLQAAYPNLQARELRDFSGLNEASGPDWEERYDQKPLSDFQPVTDFAADLIIMRLAENVTDGQVNSRNFKAYYLQLIDKLRANNQSARIVLSTSCWDKPNTTAIIKQVAQERGYPVADLSDMWADRSNYAFDRGFSNQDVAKHPGDKGMQEIANRICAQIGGLSCSSTVLSIGGTSGLSSVGTGGGNGSFTINSNVSWTISGVPSWLTLNTTSGSNNGTINVSIQSNGGPARSATLTVSGGGLSATVQISQQGTGTPTTTWQTVVGDWPAQDLVFLENSQIQVGFRKSVGGCISIIKSKTGLRGGANLVNDRKIRNNTESDKGRQVQYSSYAQPAPYTEAGSTVDIGWNGVQGGNSEGIGADPSPVLQYGRYTDPVLGEVVYTKTQPYQWDIRVLTRSYTEQWTWLSGNVVRTHARITMFRNDQYRFNQEGRPQELPCVYTIYPLNKFYYYQGTNPYTNDGLSSYQDPVTRGQQTRDIVVSEPWIASVDNNNVGLGLYVAGKSKFQTQTFLFEDVTNPYGDENTNNSTYIGYTGFDVLDNSDASNGVFDYDADIIVGSLSDIRGWVYQQQQPTFKPNYTFQNSRQGFFYHAASDQGWPISNELNISFGGYIRGDRQYPELKSPYSMWKADQVSKIYVRAAVTGYSQLALNFTKPGPVLEPDINQQSVRFNVTPDGQYRTYEINVSQNSNWNGIISHFRIQLPYPFPTPSGSERLRVQWISADPNGPSNQSNSSFTASEARVGVAESEAEMQVRVLGNPVADQLRFEVTGAEGKKLQVKVLNTTGRVVESREIGSAAPVEVQSIDLGREQRGLLLLQVTTGNQSKTVKVIR